MPENGERSGGTPEVLGFVLNALREHEQELDELIGRLGDAKDRQASINKKLYCEVERIEEKLGALAQNLDDLKTIADDPPPSSKEENSPVAERNNSSNLQPVTMKLTHWEDFRSLCSRADRVMFACDEVNRTLQVEALKRGQLLIFDGALPNEAALLKGWLVEQLEILDANNVLDGKLSLVQNGQT